LRENLLTAVPLLIQVLRILVTSCGAVEHIDKRDLREVDEGDVIQNCARVLIDNKDLFMDTWEELFLAICAVVFQELHQLGLVDYVQDSNLVLISNLLGHFNCNFFLRADDLVECR
jgi:hypothetical protein